MTPLPITPGHEVAVSPAFAGRYTAACSCGWSWRSRFETVAHRQAEGHLYNAARKAS